MKRAISLAILLAVAGCGGAEKPANPIPSAYHACSSAIEKVAHPAASMGQPGTFTLEDGAFSTEGVNSDEAEGLAAVRCVLNHLHTPTVLRDQIGSTTEAMGRQHATRKGLTYTWSNSDPTGLIMTIEEDQ